jgi:hypothetical protein
MGGAEIPYAVDASMAVLEPGAAEVFVKPFEAGMSEPPPQAPSSPSKINP